MNNIMISKELANKLILNSEDSMDFGTSIIDGGHDIDRVYIMPNYDWWIMAPIDTQHWLHYKGESNGEQVDFLFTTTSQFYRALISGLSHVPMECILNKIKPHDATEVKAFTDLFRTYRNLKSYRGLLRKDIKQAYQFKAKGSKEKLRKKMKFINDGVNKISEALTGDHLMFWFEWEDAIEKGTESDFLINAQVHHDRLQLEMNKQRESGELPNIYEIDELDGSVFQEKSFLTGEHVKDEVLAAFKTKLGE